MPIVDAALWFMGALLIGLVLGATALVNKTIAALVTIVAIACIATALTCGRLAYPMLGYVLGVALAFYINYKAEEEEVGDRV